MLLLKLRVLLEKLFEPITHQIRDPLFFCKLFLYILVLQCSSNNLTGLSFFFSSLSAQGDAGASAMGGQGCGGAAMRGRGGRGTRRQ